MAEFPYTPNPAKVAPFMKKIQTVGVPEKVTLRFIESIGFKSKNDRYLKTVIEFLGFVDSSGEPQPTWNGYRDTSRSPIVLAQAVRRAYASLFAMYEDAYRKDDEALRNFFKSNTSLADRTVGFVVRTFKSLCELADFTSEADVDLPPPQDAKRLESVKGVGLPSPQGMTLNVIIQLTLPPDKDGVVYDKFFESLKKHLLS